MWEQKELRYRVVYTDKAGIDHEDYYSLGEGDDQITSFRKIRIRKASEGMVNVRAELIL